MYMSKIKFIFIIVMGILIYRVENGMVERINVEEIGRVCGGLEWILLLGIIVLSFVLFS